MENPSKHATAEKLRLLAERHYQPLSNEDEMSHLASWFRAYMQSHEFQISSPQTKVDSFDTLLFQSREKRAGEDTAGEIVSISYYTSINMSFSKC
jgi:hypothetical protein